MNRLLVAAFSLGLTVMTSACAPGAPGPGGDRFLGETDRHEQITFSLVLKRHGEAALALAIGRGAAPLSPAEFGERHGLPLDVMRRLEQRLRNGGIAVVRRYPQRTALEVRGRADTVRRLFGVRLGDFEDRRGRPFRAPLNDPRIPVALRPSLDGVAGLDTRPFESASVIPVEGLRPTDIAKAYGVLPLWRDGIRGEGQTVAVVSFAAINPDDVERFDDETGTQGPNVEQIAVEGGNDDQTSNVALEAALDVQTVRGIAPEARILNYELPLSDYASFTRGIGVAVDSIVEDGRADFASISYGVCDVPKLADGTVSVPPADRLRVRRAIDAAVRTGLTIFVATQDTGAYTCQKFDLEDHRLSTSWPGGDPGVIAVGGTLLTLSDDGTRLEETGWEDVLSNGSGGGGLNPRDPRPRWQRGPGVINRFSNGKRQLPDVAAASDPDSGVFVVFRGEKVVVGGTSAATPFWAAAMALVQQLAEREGAGKIGFAGPMLYDLARAPQPFRPFHDVTRGGNRYYDATPGWDFATGLGSPDVDNLAHDAVAYLRAR